MASSLPITSSLSLVQGKLQYLLFNRPEWWAYAIFWRDAPENETSLLSFGDGYFRGNIEIDLKKPTKPNNTSFDTCNDTCIDTGKDGEEVEWFYVVSLARSFGTDDLSASPVRVYLSQVHLWLIESQALNGASGCERSREGYMHGIKTIVWIPVPGGVLELGSCDFIPENRVLVPQAISILANNKVARIGTGGGSSVGLSSSLDSEHSDSEDPELPVKRRRVTKRGRKSGTGQDPVINHVEAERHRREKLNNKFYALRSVVPNVSRMDKASLLSDAIEYIKELRSRVDMLEAEVKSVKTKVQMEVASSTNSISTISSPVGMEVEMRLFGAEALIRVQSKGGGGAHAPTRLMGALSELEMQVHHASIITVNDMVVQDVVARLSCGVMLQEEGLRAALLAKLLL